MSFVLAGIIGGGALGIGKAALDVSGANRKKELATIANRYSPWTGLKGEMPDTPNVLGDIGSGTALGLSGGMAVANHNAAIAKGTSDLADAGKKATEGLAAGPVAGGQGDIKGAMEKSQFGGQGGWLSGQATTQPDPAAAPPPWPVVGAGQASGPLQRHFNPVKGIYEMTNL